ncbi:MAG TPA: hypothetical protein VIU64_11935, partial [Polyangia bacterium]
PMYLRRLSDGSERTIPPGDDVVVLNDLPVERPRAQMRGAAHHAFSQIFSLPFDGAAVLAYQEELEARLPAGRDVADPARRAHRLRTTGWVAIGAGVAAGVVAGAFELSAMRLRATAGHASQAEAEARNDSIASRNRVAGALLVGAGAAATAGVVLLVVGREPPVTAAATSQSVSVAATWNF